MGKNKVKHRTISGTNVELAVESKRDLVFLITMLLITTLSTVTTFRCIVTEPYTDFGVFGALVTAAVIVFAVERDAFVILFWISSLCTIASFWCILREPTPDFGVFGALFITAIVVFVAAVGARLIWSHSVWPRAIAHLAQIAVVLASVALLLILNRPYAWFFLHNWFLWLQDLHNFMIHIQALAGKSHESVRLPVSQKNLVPKVVEEPLTLSLHLPD